LAGTGFASFPPEGFSPLPLPSAAAGELFEPSPAEELFEEESPEEEPADESPPAEESPEESLAEEPSALAALSRWRLRVP
jgi:hypothetical protein